MNSEFNTSRVEDTLKLGRFFLMIFFLSDSIKMHVWEQIQSN